MLCDRFDDLVSVAFRLVVEATPRPSEVGQMRADDIIGLTRLHLVHLLCEGLDDHAIPLTEDGVVGLVATVVFLIYHIVQSTPLELLKLLGFHDLVGVNTICIGKDHGTAKVEVTVKLVLSRNVQLFSMTVALISRFRNLGGHSSQWTVGLGCSLLLGVVAEGALVTLGMAALEAKLNTLPEGGETCDLGIAVPGRTPIMRHLTYQALVLLGHPLPRGAQRSEVLFEHEVLSRIRIVPINP